MDLGLLDRFPTGDRGELLALAGGIFLSVSSCVGYSPSIEELIQHRVEIERIPGVVLP
jgi:hypothetical protein